MIIYTANEEPGNRLEPRGNWPEFRENSPVIFSSFSIISRSIPNFHLRPTSGKHIMFLSIEPVETKDFTARTYALSIVEPKRFSPLPGKYQDFDASLMRL